MKKYSFKVINQILAALIINISTMLFGLSIQSSVIYLDHLTSGEDDMVITTEESSWIATAIMIGIMIGSLTGGIIVEIIGRKQMVMIDTILYVIGLSLQSVGRTVPMLCLGRGITGYACASTRITIQPFICETSHPELRGITTSFFMVFVTLGTSFLATMGKFLYWRTALFVPTFLAVPLFFGLFYLHESPSFLMRKSKENMAIKSLKFYRGSAYDYTAELDLIRKNLQQSAAEAKLGGVEANSSSQGMENVKGILRREFILPFSFLVVIYLLHDWCGFPILAFYMVTVFRTTGSPIDPYMCVAIVSYARIFGALLSSFTLHHFNRRPLFVLTSAGMSTSMCILASYTYLKNNGGIFLSMELLNRLNFIPLVCVMLIYTFHSAGFGSLVFLLPGELLPTRLRSVGNGILVFLFTLSGLFVSKLGPFLQERIGAEVTYWMFSGFSAFMSFFAFIAMPETKGLALEEIEANFRKKSKANSPSTLVEVMT